MHNFGRMIPKDWKHVDTYPFRRLGIGTAPTVEKVLKLPRLRTIYNQKTTNGCTGYSASWMVSIYNSFPTRIYNPLWLYYRGTLIDFDNSTSPETDVGGYIWAVMEVLRTMGHVLVKRDGTDWSPRKEEGIQSYYWCTSIDEMRTAISLDRPIVFGINWREEFMRPIRKSTGYWIGTRSSLGATLGGHAICCYGARDSLQAFKLVNTWGIEYPPTWISYSTIERLMNEYGESCVAMDL